MKQKNKGITIIALVVTIIILLILAGVSIAMLTGENGILKRAQRAKNETESAQKLENATLSEYENIIDNFKGTENFNTNKDALITTSDNDLNGWLNSWEGINISGLDEAVNNEFLMKELMNSESAVNYMITNNNIINKIATSNVAMTELGKSEYASSKIIGNKNLFDIILKSEHIEKFNVSRNIIPQLTSNISEKGEASYTGNYCYPAYYAFDGSDNTSWSTSSLGTLQFKFNKTQYAYMINLYLKTNAGLSSLLSEFNGTVALFLNDEEVYSSGEQKIKLNEELKINLDKVVEFDTIVFTQNTTISSAGQDWSGITELKIYGSEKY